MKYIQKTDVKNLPIMDESFREINHQKMKDMNHPIVDGLVKLRIPATTWSSLGPGYLWQYEVIQKSITRTFQIFFQSWMIADHLSHSK